MKRILLMITIVLSFGLIFSACNNNDKSTTLAKDETYTCKMHNQVMGNKPGKCPICGMTLVKQKMTDAQMKMMKEGTYTKPKY
jgi:membrane fusion protein, copper/silver efflux system